MAQRVFHDPTRTSFTIECPACGQKLMIAGMQLEDKEELSCANCNAVFMLRIIDEKKVEAELLKKPKGHRGAAETFDRLKRG